MTERTAKLALEDGTVYTGRAFGASGERFGESVFNTSMTGYQEVLTDPSYKGQIVTMTYPLIGNYGVNAEDQESRRPQVEGFIVRELARAIFLPGLSTSKLVTDVSGRGVGLDVVQGRVEALHGSGLGHVGPVPVPTFGIGASLAVIVGTLAVTTAASLAATRRVAQAKESDAVLTSERG